MYVLKRSSKTMSVTHNYSHYVIGFKSSTLARNVHYNIHPEPQFEFYRGQTEATNNLGVLVIPKFKQGSFLDPMNDGGFHMEKMNYDDFIHLPIKKNLGIIMTFSIEEETSEHFMLKVFVFDPLQEVNYFEI